MYIIYEMFMMSSNTIINTDWQNYNTHSSCIFRYFTAQLFHLVIQILVFSLFVREVDWVINKLIFMQNLIS